MLTKDKKKHTSSNINININFKVETKNAINGKKINTSSKEVKKNQEVYRPNTYYRKKSQFQ